MPFISWCYLVWFPYYSHFKYTLCYNLKKSVTKRLIIFVGESGKRYNFHFLLSFFYVSLILRPFPWLLFSQFAFFMILRTRAWRLHCIYFFYLKFFSMYFEVHVNMYHCETFQSVNKLFFLIRNWEWKALLLHFFIPYLLTYSTEQSPSWEAFATNHL